MEIRLTWYKFEELRMQLETVAKARVYSNGEEALTDGYKISWGQMGVVLTIPEVEAQIEKHESP